MGKQCASSQVTASSAKASTPRQRLMKWAGNRQVCQRMAAPLHIL